MKIETKEDLNKTMYVTNFNKAIAHSVKTVDFLMKELKVIKEKTKTKEEIMTTEEITGITEIEVIEEIEEIEEVIETKETKNLVTNSKMETALMAINANLLMVKLIIKNKKGDKEEEIEEEKEDSKEEVI